jgi:hypothetical protein
MPVTEAATGSLGGEDSAVRPSHICAKQMLCRSELLGTKLASANYAARP